VTAVYGARLSDQHARMLAESLVTPDHARARGYVTVDTKKLLEDLGVTKAGRNVPGLLALMHDKAGEVWGYQYRPDTPRLNGTGRPVKYETPTGQRNGIDVPPGVGPRLDDPAVPLWITEGAKKADAAVCAGLACVALPGVWSWRGTNVSGGKVAVPDWHDIALNGRQVVLAFDSDVVRKREVRTALSQLAGYLESKGAHVRYLHLPHAGDGKTGLDDYLAGHTVDELRTLVRPDPPETTDTTQANVEAEAPPLLDTPEPITLDQAHDIFRRWLGEDYDLDALDALLCAFAAERLDGDPLWMLLISGPGNAKTETIQAATGIGAYVVSTITGEAALLSATPKREHSRDATGGLLRQIGSRGLLVIKDVTSILSMNRDTRAGVLAALREIHDGRWSREVGTDGGQSLAWSGRLVVVGACTTAWDQAHAVIATMGDRFVLLRMDSTVGRVAAGRKSIGNTGSEKQMRADLAGAVAGVVAGCDPSADLSLTDEETERLLAAADLVTLARTGVEYDHRGDVIDAHAPEMPTRFAKQLAQIIRGGVSIGLDRSAALRLAIRCARDSMPPLRLAIVADIAENPNSTATDVRRRLNKPRATVDRQMQALHILDVLDVDEIEDVIAGRPVTRWHYSLADGIEPAALDPIPLPDLSVHTPIPQEKGGESVASPGIPTDISGNGVPTCQHDGCGVALYNPQSAAVGLCLVHQDRSS
jgi:Domain of unknown function (DUF3854)